MRVGGRALARASVLAAGTAAAAVAASLPAARAQQILVRSGNPRGVYKVGEKIVWHLSVAGPGAQSVSRISYVLKSGQYRQIGQGSLPLRGGRADLTTTLNAPGEVYAELTATPAGRPAIQEAAGALVSPSQIRPSAPPPADFDAFWKSKLRELHAVPIHPVLEKGDSGLSWVDYWKVTLDNVHGTKVRGQLARPKAGKKLPALVVFQWAGIYPLKKEWATDRAREGWLTLNINAHDLPIDQPQSFYDAQKNGPLKEYISLGADDRNKTYFLRMYLGVYRALEYLSSRPDWDGKTLVVMGTSQGGLQSLVAAGLYPKVTAVLADVPAGCDQSGPAVGRAPGWPNWYLHTQGRDAAKVHAACRYYDTVNFARRIHCPILIGTGLIDTTCPAHGVAAAYNQIRAPKKLLVMDRADHGGKDRSQAEYYHEAFSWLSAFRAGRSAPVAVAQRR